MVRRGPQPRSCGFFRGPWFFGKSPLVTRDLSPAPRELAGWRRAGIGMNRQAPFLHRLASAGYSTPPDPRDLLRVFEMTHPTSTDASDSRGSRETLACRGFHPLIYRPARTTRNVTFGRLRRGICRKVPAGGQRTLRAWLRHRYPGTLHRRRRSCHSRWS